MGGRPCATRRPYILSPLIGVEIKCLFISGDVKTQLGAKTIKKTPVGTEVYHCAAFVQGSTQTLIIADVERFSS